MEIESIEIWKEIEGGYKISNLGRLKNKNNKLLKQYKNKKTGYVNVFVVINRKRQVTSLHRLVAKTFLPNIDNLPEVNHINGDKSDNRVLNLQWISRDDNLKHSKDNKLSRKNFKKVIYLFDGEAYNYMVDISNKYDVNLDSLRDSYRSGRGYYKEHKISVIFTTNIYYDIITRKQFKLNEQEVYW